MSTRKNRLTKHGLTGSSGFNVEGLSGLITHITAPYAAGKDRVFVDWYDRGDPVPRWKQMTLAWAKREKRRIIPCYCCDKPAVSVDHYYPYHCEMNHCATHTREDCIKLAKENGEY